MKHDGIRLNSVLRISNAQCPTTISALRRERSPRRGWRGPGTRSRIDPTRNPPPAAPRRSASRRPSSNPQRRRRLDHPFGREPVTAAEAYESTLGSGRAVAPGRTRRSRATRAASASGRTTEPRGPRLEGLGRTPPRRPARGSGRTPSRRTRRRRARVADPRPSPRPSSRRRQSSSFFASSCPNRVSSLGSDALSREGTRRRPRLAVTDLAQLRVAPTVDRRRWTSC